MASDQQEISPLNPLLGNLDVNIGASVTNTAAKDESSSLQRSSEERTLKLRSNHEEPSKKNAHNAIGELNPEALRRKNVFKLWWVELLSIFFSLICLTTNVGVLIALNNEQYESWEIAQVNVTPNTIVSIIATFTKASLLLVVAEVIAQLKWLYFQARTQTVSHLQLFDDASRGPLGSLRLLWKVNLHSTVASLAAIITVFALAIEPFTQQIIRYPTRENTALNISAAISTTNIFSPSDFNSAINREALLATEQQELSIAVDSGISKSAASAVYTCPSGSCTWPAFSSLALCNYCKDITSHINVTCSNDATNGTNRFCLYSVGSDYLLQVLAWNLWTKTDDDTYVPITSMNVSVPSSYVVDDAWDWVSPPGGYTFIDFVRFNDSYHSVSSQAPDNILPTLMQCELKWCVQYHGSTRYENGTLFDIPEFSVPITDSESDPDTYRTDTTKLSPAQARQFDKTTTEFIINDDFAETLFEMIGSILHKTIFKPVDEQSDVSEFSNLLPSQYRAEYESVTANQLDLGRSYSLYYANDGDLSKTMDNIALSVTNSMRSSLNSNNITGSAMYTVVYIEVVWPWLIYTAALLIAAAILLGFTICLSYGSDKMVWKSSSLALLFHGLSDGEAYGTILSTGKMEKVADGIWVRLTEDETGNVRLKVS